MKIALAEMLCHVENCVCCCHEVSSGKIERQGEHQEKKKSHIRYITKRENNNPRKNKYTEQ